MPGRKRDDEITMLAREARQHDKATVRLTREGLYHTLDIGGALDWTGCQLNRE